MMTYQQVRRGVVCRHHSGRVYTVMSVSNEILDDPKFPSTVHYVGANGREWSRKLTEFVDKFDVLYDGTQLAPTPNKG